RIEPRRMELTTGSTRQCRVGIVGAGLSGLRVAADLGAGEFPIQILIWEQGPLSRLHHEGHDRRVHPGDDRLRLWPAVSTLWGQLSGVKARVGGRSLCWHGQLLPLEDYALVDWPGSWRERLGGNDDLY